MGVESEETPLRIFNRLVSRIPAFKGLSYRLLAQVTEQWPIVGRSDLYYGGTLYANAQGLGEQLSLPAQIPSLVWPQVQEINSADGAILAVPITVLFDQGNLVYRSMLLHQRIPPAYVEVRPEDAQRLNLANGIQVQFSADGISLTATLRLNEQVPPGVALVPRSMGIPIGSPIAIDLKVV